MSIADLNLDPGTPKIGSIADQDPDLQPCKIVRFTVRLNRSDKGWWSAIPVRMHDQIVDKVKTLIKIFWNWLIDFLWRSEQSILVVELLSSEEEEQSEEEEMADFLQQTADTSEVSLLFQCGGSLSARIRHFLPIRIRNYLASQIHTRIQMHYYQGSGLME